MFLTFICQSLSLDQVCLFYVYMVSVVFGLDVSFNLLLYVCFKVLYFQLASYLITVQSTFDMFKCQLRNII